MASEIKLPELGEKVEGGEVVDVKVAAGDQVRVGQPLIEVEAEKSTVEVPSPVAGQVTQMLVKKGDKVTTGQTLCLVEARDGRKEEGPKTAPAQKSAAEARPEPKQPAVAQRLPAQPAAPAPPPQPTAQADHAGDGQKPQPAEPVPGALVPAGPATRRLARELGVALEKVQGTAPSGRVTQEDVKAYVRQLAAAPARSAGRPVPQLPGFERWGPVERKPLDNVRRRTAEQMSLSWTLIPHVTQHDQADITELEAFRKQQEGKRPKLTVTAFALKAVAIALRQFPQCNTSLDEAAGQLVFKNYYHLGVAVDTDRGLLVPVIRDVDKKGVQALAMELADLAERARQKKITADEMRGGTFTITNLGGIGGTAFTPIINYPEVAILGMSRGRWQPVMRDGEMLPRLILPLSLSYDHRVIDGAGAARFARRVAELLESPWLMVLHG
jgi:pyruvate dehydrogenase E2 component (dihydrolipoamide acetyltransferase)